FFKYHYGWQPGDEGPRNHFDSQAVRMGFWKGVRTGINQDPQGPVQLFNLKDDPEEQNDIAQSHPEIVEKLGEIMTTARRDSEFFQANQ
ncbi:MAG: hypothetical protein KAT15_07255, partial [Bacteroidales bacterium]|nr:hypothetical protein [Bacteroidales bacterium]